MTETQLLTTSQICKATGLKRPTIVELSDTKQIPSITLPGGHRRFNLAQVQEALKDNLGNGYTPDPLK